MRPANDSVTRLVPPSRSAAPWRVVDAVPREGFRVGVTFVDGTAGEVDMRPFLDGSGVEGTVFEPVREPSVFRRLRVESGAVTWPNGADLAPDAMCDAIRQRGSWTVPAQ